jgi:hypothetical protein
MVAIYEGEVGYDNAPYTEQTIALPSASGELVTKNMKYFWVCVDSIA